MQINVTDKYTITNQFQDRLQEPKIREARLDSSTDNPANVYNEVDSIISKHIHENGKHPIVYTPNHNDLPRPISDESIRKRVNPLYEGNNSISSNSPVKSSSEVRQYCVCVFIICSLFFIIAAASFGMSIYLLVTRNSHNLPGSNICFHCNATQKEKPEVNTAAVTQKNHSINEKYRSITNMVQKIQSEMDKLKDKYENASQELDFNISKMAVELNTMKKQMIENIANVSHKWEMFKEQINVKVNNISKLPGPPGPRGEKGESGPAGFFNCYYAQTSQETTSQTSSAESTNLIPNSTVLQGHVALAASCSVEGGKSYNLKAVTDLWTRREQYKCTCSGWITGVSRRLCTTHIWLCPAEP